MAKKAKPLKIEPVAGWFLISREEVAGEDLSVASYGPRWYVAWLEPFGTKKEALAFARKNNWYAPFKAVRGQIEVQA